MSAVPPLPATPETPTLDNCDREPIHVPGSIQPHGALLAFDRLGRLRYASANAALMLGVTLEFGRTLKATDLDGQAGVHDLLQRTFADAAQAPDDEISPTSQEARLHGETFDVVVHATRGTTIAEFERRIADGDEISRFAQVAYRAMDGLKRQRSIERLLDAAVEAVRELTGFDRVMAYRFRHDDSGDVVAERCRAELEPYLGRRYPASDIPAQARRLYILNTLRLIADVAYAPVPLLAEPATTEPLDLSHSVLRSVSPIHVEYLRNMGVGASMSVSIVVGGKLWGMLACHHMTALQVPFSLRMAADVIAQLIASTVQSLTAQEREATAARAAFLRTELATAIAQGAEVTKVLCDESAALQNNLHADALVVTLDGKPICHGDVDRAWIDALLVQLREQPLALVHETQASRLPPQAGREFPDHCGVLAMRFDGPRQGWLIALRREQVQTIRWGGKPEKAIAHGPLGPRLTPRGSFAEWRETVRGTAVPWDDNDRETASQLLDALSRAHATRVLEIDQLRSQLWAVLGHDLRNPLQSLTMASRVLDRGDASGRMNVVIRNSADRMAHLLQDVLDVARLQNGMALQIRSERQDLVPLVKQLVEALRVAHPAVTVDLESPDTLMADVDAVRFAQLVDNLLNNARVHGQGHIGVCLSTDGTDAVIELRNAAEPIAPQVAATLFDPFKRGSLDNARNRSGMGLGLYIADQIVRGHGGRLAYRHEGGEAVFEVWLPLTSPVSPPPDTP